VLLRGVGVVPEVGGVRFGFEPRYLALFAGIVKAAPEGSSGDP
jgi:hypothetical protein